jgi:sugar lactone lactonase YvrE
MWRLKGLLALAALSACTVAAPVVGAPSGRAQASTIEQAPYEFSYPEGPLIVGDVARVAEMGAGQVSALPLARPWTTTVLEDAWSIPNCGPTALSPYGDGFVVLCHLSGDLAVVDADGAEQRRIGTFDGVSLRNPNDGASDLRGGVYFSDPGDFYRPRQPVGRVVWLDPNGRLHAVASGLNYPNGVYVVEDDGRRFAYVSEHFSRRILRYPINEDGSFGAMSVWVVIPEQSSGARFTYDQAGPDGLERGPDGHWCVAIYGEGRVLRLNAEGSITGEIETPFQYVTNVATTETGVYVVGPFVHDRAPFQGGALFAPYSAFGPLP